MDVSSNSETGRIEGLIGAWVSQDGFGIDSSLVGECAETGDVVVGRNIDLNGLCNKAFEVTELLTWVR